MIAVVAGAALLIGLVATVVLMHARHLLPWTMFDEDAAVASYAKDLSEAMLQAATAKPHDTRWNGADPRSDLRGTDDAARRALASLGGEPKVALVTMELQASVADGAGHESLRTIAAVTNGGQLRWIKAERNRYDFPTLSPMHGLDRIEPVLSKAIDRILINLSGACNLKVLLPSDVAELPTELRKDLLRGTSDIASACKPGSAEAGWTPQVDDVAVLVQANGNWAVLKSQLELVAGKLQLRPVRVQVLKSDTPAPQTTPGGAPIGIPECAEVAALRGRVESCAAIPQDIRTLLYADADNKMAVFDTAPPSGAYAEMVRRKCAASALNLTQTLSSYPCK